MCYEDGFSECAICVPGQCPGPDCPGFVGYPPDMADADLGGHEPDCDGDWHPDMDGSGVFVCSCSNVQCEAGFVTGPAFDHYGVSCVLSVSDHKAQRAAGKSVTHLGVNPLPGPGAEPQYVLWQGGGHAAGDPLPLREVHYLDGEQSAALRELAGSSTLATTTGR